VHLHLNNSGTSTANQLQPYEVRGVEVLVCWS